MTSLLGLAPRNSLVSVTECDNLGQGQPFKASVLIIMLCLEGEAVVKINMTAHRLTHGCQLVVLPHAVVEVCSVGEGFRALCIHCAESLFGDLCSTLDPSFLNYMREHPSASLPVDEVNLVKQLGQLIRRACDDPGNCFRRQMAANYMQNLLFHFYNKTRSYFADVRKPLGRKEELFADFLQLVHRHCFKQRDVTYYAGEMNITPRYLSTIVIAATGETAKQIIDRHAIVEIKLMLTNTRLSAQQISQLMNFASPSFFGRFFKKHTGLSPQEFRKQK